VPPSEPENDCQLKPWVTSGAAAAEVLAGAGALAEGPTGAAAREAAFAIEAAETELASGQEADRWSACVRRDDSVPTEDSRDRGLGGDRGNVGGREG